MWRILHCFLIVWNLEERSHFYQAIVMMSTDNRIFIDFGLEYMQQDTQSDDDKSLPMSSFSLVPNSSYVLRSQCGMNKSYRPWRIDTNTICWDLMSWEKKWNSLMFLIMTLFWNVQLVLHFNELKHIYDGTITRQKVTELCSKLAEVDTKKM